MISTLLSFTFKCRSSLVPVFGFGQNDCFHIPISLDYLRSYKPGCTRLEKWFKILVRNTLMAFCGKYKFIPALPYNKPITVVGMIWNKLLALIKLNMVYLLFDVGSKMQTAKAMYIMGLIHDCATDFLTYLSYRLLIAYEHRQISSYCFTLPIFFAGVGSNQSQKLIYRCLHAN